MRNTSQNPWNHKGDVFDTTNNMDERIVPGVQSITNARHSEERVNKRPRMNVVWYDGPRRRGWCSITLDDGEQRVNKRRRMCDVWYNVPDGKGGVLRRLTMASRANRMGESTMANECRLA